MSNTVHVFVQIQENDVKRHLDKIQCTVFHEYLAGIIFSEFVILEISRVFNLAIPKNRAG